MGRDAAGIALCLSSPSAPARSVSAAVTRGGNWCRSAGRRRQTYSTSLTTCAYTVGRRVRGIARSLFLVVLGSARQARWGDRQRESGKATVNLTFLVLFLQRQRRKEVWASKEEEGFRQEEEEEGGGRGEEEEEGRKMYSKLVVNEVVVKEDEGFTAPN